LKLRSFWNWSSLFLASFFCGLIFLFLILLGFLLLIHHQGRLRLAGSSKVIVSGSREHHILCTWLGLSHHIPLPKERARIRILLLLSKQGSLLLWLGEGRRSWSKQRSLLRLLTISEHILVVDVRLLRWWRVLKNVGLLSSKGSWSSKTLGSWLLCSKRLVSWLNLCVACTSSKEAVSYWLSTSDCFFLGEWILLLRLHWVRSLICIVRPKKRTRSSLLERIWRLWSSCEQIWLWLVKDRNPWIRIWLNVVHIPFQWHWWAEDVLVIAISKEPTSLIISVELAIQGEVWVL